MTPDSIPELSEALRRPTWMERAACRGLDASLFFPERGEMVSQTTRDVCASCPVQAECLDYALEIKERDGVWGGKSGRQRRDLRSASAERNQLCTCIECGAEFVGNYRSKICSATCRARRQNGSRSRTRRTQ